MALVCDCASPCPDCVSVWVSGLVRVCASVSVFAANEF